LNAIIIATITLIQGIAIALISGLFNRETKRRKEEQARLDKRADIRAQEGLLSMKLMATNTSLTIATAIAVQEGTSNGKMSKALAEAEKAQQEYYEFIDRAALSQINK